jgi:hypothetical protein
MKITGILWLEEVVEKLRRKHGVEPDEVEELLDGRPRIRRLEAGRVKGEDLYAATGRSSSGRYLLVLFIRKTTGEALIVSARDLTRRERRLHGKK